MTRTWPSDFRGLTSKICCRFAHGCSGVVPFMLLVAPSTSPPTTSMIIITWVAAQVCCVIWYDKLGKINGPITLVGGVKRSGKQQTNLYNRMREGGRKSSLHKTVYNKTVRILNDVTKYNYRGKMTWLQYIFYFTPIWPKSRKSPTKHGV